MLLCAVIRPSQGGVSSRAHAAPTPNTCSPSFCAGEHLGWAAHGKSYSKPLRLSLSFSLGASGVRVAQL